MIQDPSSKDSSKKCKDSSQSRYTLHTYDLNEQLLSDRSTIMNSTILQYIDYPINKIDSQITEL